MNSSPSFCCGPLLGEAQPGKQDVTLKGRFSLPTSRPCTLVSSTAGSGGVQSRLRWRLRLGANLVERIERLDPSEIARRQWERQRKAFDKKDRDRDASRDMAQIDYEVIVAGFCFLSIELTSGEPADRRRATGYIRQLFDLEMTTLPILEGEDEGREVGGTPYEFDRWILDLAAELLATVTSLDQARAIYRTCVAPWTCCPLLDARLS